MLIFMIMTMLWAQLQDKAILAKLSKLKVWKGAGPDKLSPALPKFLAQHIYFALTKLVQYSYDNHLTPQDWCIANVIPIYRKEKGRPSKL